jgi:hypothetical protein
MSEPPSNAPANAGRNPDGTFAKGNRINPAGKPKGARHRATQMVDALLFRNVRGISEVLIREGLAGQGWAVKAALTGMLPTRSRRIDEPIDLKLPASVDEAAAQIAWLASSIAKGAVDIDVAQTLIGALQAFVQAHNVATIERRAEQGLEEIVRLKAELAEMVARMKTET